MTSPARLYLPLCLSGLLLASCASTGGGKTPTAAAKPPLVTMAPIANPSAGEHREHPAREPVEHENPPARPEPKPEAPKPPPPKPAPPPAPAAKAGPDPQRAARLRTQGLTRLNGGQVDRAIALLQEAAQLDPGNALIKKDLERAQRIGRLVHGGK